MQSISSHTVNLYIKYILEISKLDISLIYRKARLCF